MTKGTKPASPSRPPAEGERAARRGYVHQDRASARLAYDALVERKLRWIGLADRGAGDVDDLILGLRHEIQAHQFKKSLQPAFFGITGLLLGKGSEIANLVGSYGALAARHASMPVRIKYFTNDIPSPNDKLVKDDKSSTTAEFVDEWKKSPRRSLLEWRATRWQGVMDDLVTASGLADKDFEAFWLQFELICGAEASSRFEPSHDKTRENQIEELSRAIGTLVADNPDKDLWSREELLQEAGWPDRFSMRFQHRFPVGAWVQRNSVSGTRLSKAISKTSQGYISLIGAPGAGKSTLLARELGKVEGAEVVRYLAFVPGTAQGQGRGEAEAFYHDLTTQLLESGLPALRLKDDSLHARREHFEALVAKAGERFAREKTRTIIIVDGLDHIPREEFPAHSLLSALPLPQSIPDGVLFILGSQRLDLPGMPGAVEQQAASTDRRIDIAPLTEVAVEAMAQAAGLDPDIDRSEIYRVGGGHPLVTRYLIERLLLSEPADQQLLLDGDFGEGGDLEAVYQSTWRWIEKAPDPLLVKRVLALIAYAQGPIEPELLAEETNDAAVEATLQVTRHLLNTGGKGWSVFHNSFRLFIQRKPIERFGKPDPEFSPPVIYRRLGALVSQAAPDSPQRWLGFRYAVLAGNAGVALDLATRDYFVGQYLDGRDERRVVDDICDGYNLLADRQEPTKLFELLLAEDEIERRSSVMESASTLIAAYIAMGDIDAAKAELDNNYEEGQQWLLVDALLKENRIDEARALFEDNSPFRDPDTRYQMGSTDAFEERLADWAKRAIIFLDDEQIQAELAQINERADAAFKDEFKDLAGQTVAQAIILADPGRDLDALCKFWLVDGPARVATAIEGAHGADLLGDEARTLELLELASTDPEFSQLDASWMLPGATLCARLGKKDLAERFLQHAPLRGPGNLAAFNSEQLEEACRTLSAGIITRTTLGVPFQQPTEPASRLLKGLQNHILAVSNAIGDIRAGKPLSATDFQRAAMAALTFLAGARHDTDDDPGAFHRLPKLALILLDLLFDLAELADLPGSAITDLVARLVEEDAVFKYWPAFLRASAMRRFHLDANVGAAAQSLEQALAGVECSDPRSEVEELAHFAADFADIGRTERARHLIAGLRERAFGAFQPAKKDAQYDFWAMMLGLANRADPARHSQRATTILHFVEGLQETEGYDMARRMVRQLLFEVATADVKTAAIGFHWSMTEGSVGWDGAVDATLRGFVSRHPARAREALAAWSALCLPWYGEPHGSIVETGAFLTDLILAVDLETVAEFEDVAAQAIETMAHPPQRLGLMHALEKACAQRGQGALARARLAHLASIEPSEGSDGADPRNNLHNAVLTLGQAREAIDKERNYQPETRKGMPEHFAEPEDYRPSWNLRVAISRVIASSSWGEVEEFANAEPGFMDEPEVALAAARVAKAAGHLDAAERCLAVTQIAQDDGWAWPSERRTIQRHEARRLLGIDGAQEEARQDFFRYLAGRRYGVSNILCSIDRIFPLIFSNLSWPDMWAHLEAQLRLSRDFNQGALLTRLEQTPAPAGSADDDDLLAEVFFSAITLGAALLNDSAMRGAGDLLDTGGASAVLRLADRLLGEESTALAAADLLARTVDHPSIRTHFSSRLDDIAGRDDIALISAAELLADRWGLPISIKPKVLPSFYQLALPPIDPGEGRVEVHPHTRGMFLDEPLGWTQNWTSECAAVAEAGGVTVEHVRRRLGTFIHSWGGVARFGHAGCVELEKGLTRLQLRLGYQFPHVTAVFRAMRTVAAELHHAGRLNARTRTKLLYRLYADARHPLPLHPSPRPSDALMIRPKANLWEKEREAWVHSVDEELVSSPPLAVLAEIRKVSGREIRRDSSVETYRAISLDGVDENQLLATVRTLPHVTWLGSPCIAYSREKAHPARIACFRSRRKDRLPEELLILCPHTAHSLGWSPAPESIHRFVDSAGLLMAWTIWWRDGLHQSQGDDEFRAEGQRICLSEAGQAKFERLFGPIKLRTAAWRRAAGDTPDELKTAFATTT
ncbi:ATP-binding protein (plasmid) [Sphingobium sp. V4]|uniref:ATP-binding protein n=1 Tax=Sphingobium sp. V4 TaxID=3038927 RepID=UPI00255834EC|nr:ATP-binding protein [Sphingobium sp. V4]WIW90334.1 ATP-binding protein [Sphingobium sp. V4]